MLRPAISAYTDSFYKVAKEGESKKGILLGSSKDFVCLIHRAAGFTHCFPFPVFCYGISVSRLSD